MLTRELAIAVCERGRIVPDRLTVGRHGRYLDHAGKMLAVYRSGIGRTRQELHRSIRGVFSNETDAPCRRIDAFCKLLDDVSDFDSDRHGAAAELRREVFRRAAPSHPLVRTPDQLYERGEADVKSAIAIAMGLTWGEIETRFFADVMEFHRLTEFTGYPDGRALLSRYNVAQTQAALYDAREMIVWAREDFKTILRYAKLARLLHAIRRLEDGRYEIRLDGPASVLRHTRRYGAAMAKFLPSLLACRGWRMRAVIETRRPGWLAAIDLSPEDGLHSHLPAPEAFDSSIEEAFAAKWGPGRREGWALVREGAILHHGQRVFVPDFLFRHEDGREVLMEIVGYWTPEYLEAKRQTLRLFADPPILLAVSEALSESAAPRRDSGRAIWFKSTIRLESVLRQLNTGDGGRYRI